MTLDSKAHVACRSKEPMDSKVDPYAELRQIAVQVPKSIGKKEFNGQMLEGFSGTITVWGQTGVLATVWVDPQTRLPVRIELSVKGNDPGRP